ncbi:MAG TPA: murein biosynthesis integral membrane protein MurJ [Steroidobacteraceae bacterium]|jgi:putative peptidoglycan lipid II flippase|nr:murein biosynthesis integral membrane protein MurJ [Steroidobacteraceae bacterium]
MPQSEIPAAAPSNAAGPPRHEKLNTRAAGVVALAVLGSRILGLVRDQVFGTLFGGGEVMDAFIMAFRIPNLMRDLFAEGALSTAFITVFTKTTAVEGERAAWELANKVATAAAVLVSLLTLIGILCAPWIVAVLAHGFAPAKAALTVSLTRIMFPFILLVSLAALVMGMLNARNVFGIPATASSFFNLGSIIAGAGIGWAIDPHFGQRATVGLAIGTLIGGAMQLAVQLPSLKRLGYRFRPDFRWRDKGVRAVLQLMGPSVIAASSTQVNVLVNSVFASNLGNGPVTWLQYSFRLMQLPLGIFGVALGTVSLPLLARMAAGGNIVGFRTELARGMRLAFLLTIPASIGLILLAGPIMSVLFQHGRFTAYDALEAADALRFYAIGLCGYAALKVLVNAFYAIDQRKTPMFVSFGAVGLNLLLNWVFTMRLGWGHQGLAFSTACIATTNFIVLYLLMHRHLGRLESRAMVSLLLRLSVASAVLAAICWAGDHYLLAGWASERFLPKAGALAAVIVAGAGAFLLCATALRIREMQDIVLAVQRRLRRAA